MDLVTSGAHYIWQVPYLIVVPIYILLSPLCIISSSLFDAALGFTFDIDKQMYILIGILVGIWGLSAFSIFDLIKNRAYKSIFFYSFVFYLSIFNFILIGITYSILRRNNLLEELLAKILTTMLLVYFAEKLKIKTENSSCRICFLETHHDDCMVLACRHFFHEKCLWDWLYVKNQCPICCRPVKQ